MTKPLGINKWYGYSDLYDFETGLNKYPDTAKEQSDKDKVDVQAHYLKSLLWKSYSKVSFAVRAPWVVGRFCTSGTSIKSTQGNNSQIENVENVNPICVETTDDYNKCYNRMALKFHNE